MYRGCNVDNCGAKHPIFSVPDGLFMRQIPANRFKRNACAAFVALALYVLIPESAMSGIAVPARPNVRMMVVGLDPDDLSRFITPTQDTQILFVPDSRGLSADLVGSLGPDIILCTNAEFGFHSHPAFARKPTQERILPNTLRREYRNVSTLTLRQAEVLSLIYRGLTNKEIADVLHVSVRTAKGYVSNLLLKLDVTNRTELVGRAADLELLP